MTATKTERSEAAKKAAATRQGKAAAESFTEARRAVGSAAGELVSAGKHAATGAQEFGKSVANRAKALTTR